MSGPRPVIGMAAGVESACWGPWEEPAVLLPKSYGAAVQRAGGMALLVPPDDALAERPDELLDRIDGLLLAGGSDIDPASYGAAPDPETAGVDPARDRSELALARRALERDLPILGICRGMQVLNVAAGGTLLQHLKDGGRHRTTPGTFHDHDVELEPSSLAARAVGAPRTSVKSHHHQAVALLGEGLVASAHSPDDGVVEAIEAPSSSFVLGVLWHPEADEESRVIGALVDEARSRVSGEAA